MATENFFFMNELDRHLHARREDIVYLNYAATSFPKSRVALRSFYQSLSAPPDGVRQTGSDTYLQEMRKRTAALLEIPINSVYFTHSATVGLNQVIKGFMKEGFCLAIDNRSHNAVVRPWLSLKNSSKCLLAELYDVDDRLIESHLLDILSYSPHLFCLTHASNVSGSVYPIEHIIDLIRLYSPSTTILVDASQSAGALDLSSLNKADFLVFPSHKHLHSVPGAAVLVAKQHLEPIILGGTGVNSMTEETFNEHDYFAEVGTMNLPAIQAMVDSLEFAMETLKEHQKKETMLVSQFLEGVRQNKGQQVVGRAAEENRLPVIALKPQYGSPELHWASFLKTQKIFVRGGVHCSPLHHQQLNLGKTGTLRFSFGWDTTSEDIEKALNALREFSSIAKEVFSDAAS